MDIKSIQEILRYVNKSELTEVEIEQKDFKLRILRKQPENVVVSAVPQTVQPVVQQIQQPAVIQQEPARETKAASAETSQESNKNLIEFKAPFIGTFYRSPSPDKEAFVKVGDTVSKGQVLGIIEAMKLFNEIEADFDGKIVKILVENAQPVEYEQALFLIEPS